MQVHTEPVNNLNLRGSHAVQVILSAVFEQDLLKCIKKFKS